MATYLTEHHGGGWMYQRAIPKHLQPMFGGKKVMREYIPKAVGKAMAEAMARKWAAELDAVIFGGSLLSDRDRQALVAQGGLTEVTEGNDHTFRYMPQPREIVFEPNSSPFTTPPTREQMIEDLAEGRALVAAHRLTQGKAIASLSWDSLFKEWERISEAKVTRRHFKTTELLKDYFGECNCREITDKQVAEFRDWLEKQGASRGTVEQRLKHIKAMFSTASGEPTSQFHRMGNPAAGVVPIGKAPAKAANGRDKAFTAEEVRTILDTADNTRFGDNKHHNGLKRHVEAMWMLRLLAYTGARPNEIAQLQGGDVYEKDAVKLIHIRATNADGEPHPQKHVKTSEDRLVPLHPDVIEFFDYAARFERDAFVFGAFEYDKDNGRASWVIKSFGRFLKEECKITGKTLYGLRHRFHDAMDEAEVPDKIAMRLVGHAAKGEHGKYGGNVLKLMAQWMQKVKPLG